MTCTSIYNPLLTPIRKDGNRILLDIIKMVPNPYRKIVRMIAKQYNVDSMENSDTAYIQPPPPPPPPGRHVHAPIIDKTTVPLGKYPMGKSQPAQIDCRYCECVHHKDGACHNISPSITLNNFPAKGQMWTCWSKTNKPKL